MICTSRLLVSAEVFARTAIALYRLHHDGCDRAIHTFDDRVFEQAQTQLRLGLGIHAHPRPVRIRVRYASEARLNREKRIVWMRPARSKCGQRTSVITILKYDEVLRV